MNGAFERQQTTRAFPSQKQRVLRFLPTATGFHARAMVMLDAAASLLRRGSPQRYHDVTADAIDDRHGCKQANRPCRLL
jgi:hypothetical protein